MFDNTLSTYISASSEQTGPLAIFNIYGPETGLLPLLDARVGKRYNAGVEKGLETHELHYGWLQSEAGLVIDEVLLAKPREGERVLTCHGGRAVREAVEEYLRRNSVRRLAWRKEGKEGEGEGEAVGWATGDPLFDPALAGCLSEGQAAAILLARERGEKVAAGIGKVRRVALVGAPNAGKSSLLNALAGYDRAFVDAEAGATRDVVEEEVEVGGYPLRLCDLPGFSEAGSDAIALAASRMARERLSGADMIWLVLDGSLPWDAVVMREVMASINPGDELLVIVNKVDLPCRLLGEPWREKFPNAGSVRVSSLSGGNAAEVLAGAVHVLWSVM